MRCLVASAVPPAIVIAISVLILGSVPMASILALPISLAIGLLVHLYRRSLAVAIVGSSVSQVVYAPPVPRWLTPSFAISVYPPILSYGVSAIFCGFVAVTIGLIPLSTILVATGVLALVVLAMPPIMAGARVRNRLKELEDELPWFVITMEAAFSAGKPSVEYVLNFVVERSCLRAFKEEARILLRDVREVFRSYIEVFGLRSRVIKAETYARFLSGLTAVMAESVQAVIGYLQMWIEELMRVAQFRWETFRHQITTLVTMVTGFVVLLPVIGATFGMLGQMQILDLFTLATMMCSFGILSFAYLVKPRELYSIPPSVNIAIVGTLLGVGIMGYVWTKSIPLTVLAIFLSCIPATLHAEIVIRRVDRFEWELVHLLKVLKDLVAMKLPLPLIISRLKKRASELFGRETQQFVQELENSLNLFNTFEQAMSAPVARRSFLAMFFVQLMELMRSIGKLSPSTLELVSRYYLYVKNTTVSMKRHLAVMLALLFAAPVMLVGIAVWVYPMIASFRVAQGVQMSGVSTSLPMFGAGVSVEEFCTRVASSASLLVLVISIIISIVLRRTVLSLSMLGLGLGMEIALLMILSLGTGVPITVLLGLPH